MTNQDDENREKGEMRYMWIGTGAIVLFILGLMGYNMMFNHDASTSTELSSQSRPAPAPEPTQ